MSKCTCDMKLKDGSFGIHGDEPTCPTHGTKAPKSEHKECTRCGKIHFYPGNYCDNCGREFPPEEKKTPPSKAPLREQMVAAMRETVGLNLVESEHGSLAVENAVKIAESHADSQVREALERIDDFIDDLPRQNETNSGAVRNYLDQELKKLEEK